MSPSLISSPWDTTGGGATRGRGGRAPRAAGSTWRPPPATRCAEPPTGECPVWRSRPERRSPRQHRVPPAHATPRHATPRHSAAQPGRAAQASTWGRASPWQLLRGAYRYRHNPVGWNCPSERRGETEQPSSGRQHSGVSSFHFNIAKNANSYRSQSQPAADVSQGGWRTGDGSRAVLASVCGKARSARDKMTPQANRVGLRSAAFQAETGLPEALEVNIHSFRRHTSIACGYGGRRFCEGWNRLLEITASLPVSAWNTTRQAVSRTTLPPDIQTSHVAGETRDAHATSTSLRNEPLVSPLIFVSPRELPAHTHGRSEAHAGRSSVYAAPPQSQTRWEKVTMMGQAWKRKRQSTDSLMNGRKRLETSPTA